jgi:hypothetical protein
MEGIDRNDERNKAWGTLTVTANVQISGTWGLTEINLGRVMTILSQYPELIPSTYQPRITLPALRILIRALDQDDLSLDKLNEGVDTYFQKKITAPQSTPLPKATIRPFNGKWILVAGTGDSSISLDERLVSEILGRRLAEEGFGLIGGGWQGVDAEVARSFAKSLMSTSQDVNERLVQLLEPTQHSAYDFGRPIYTESSDWNLDAAQRADALVMIGGKGGTFDAYERFRMTGKNIVPIAATGGDAHRAFDQLTSEGSPQINDHNWQFLEGTIGTAEKAENVCQNVVLLLQYLPSSFLT